MHPDRLPTGTPLGWGTSAKDHNNVGLYVEGPQPATTFYKHLVKSSTDQPEPLPPALAQLVLTVEAKRANRLRQLLFRAAISPEAAQLPIEAIRRRMRHISRGQRERFKIASASR